MGVEEVYQVNFYIYFLKCDAFLISMLPRLPIMTRIIYWVNYNLTVWPFQNLIVTFNFLSLDPNETVGVLSKLTYFVFMDKFTP